MWLDRLLWMGYEILVELSGGGHGEGVDGQKVRDAEDIVTLFEEYIIG